MKTLILGGVKSGKSREAERIATQHGSGVSVIATALPGDDEMKQRIARHQQQRPTDWQVEEVPYELAATLHRFSNNGTARAVVIVDCLTLWLTQLLCSQDYSQAIDRHIDTLIDAVTQFNGHLVLVANESGLGVTPTDPLSRQYLDCAGVLHQRVAAACDNVTLMVAGIPMVVR